MDLYAENILDHFRHPRNHGELLDADIYHQEENLECGDEVYVWLQLGDASSTSSSSCHPERSAAGAETKDEELDSAQHDKCIENIGWTGTGCAISQASMSILSEELMGKSEEEVLTLSKDDVYEMLGVPIGPRRFKCALMSLHCVKNALRKARGEEPMSWVETVALE